MKVLVVDDKKSVRDFVSQLLVSLGYNVVTAENGLDGFEKAQNTSFQLYIVDHLMPLMNGVTLSRNLKQATFCSQTPILFMSTQGKNSVESLPEFHLFSGIINKPLNEAEFTSQVKCLIGNVPSKIAL
jgi:CheY-like chemotaxis protein